uniref:WD repeat-containing protein DWA2-like n=1 Tax=Rhizophora mucronata TaxID=61149 RepID=A0A2P2JC79_RHIMU
MPEADSNIDDRADKKLCRKLEEKMMSENENFQKNKS